MTEATLDRTIGILDDEPANVALLERVLGRAGYSRLVSITDPRDLPLLLERRPDLVLLDLHMPHRDGFEVLEALRDALAPTEFLPVLVLTADVSKEVRRRALDAGAHDFLTKPLDPTEVLLRCRNLLRTRVLHLERERENERLEAMVRERTRELEAALAAAGAASAAKSRFLATLSHELKTPLTAIQASLTLLRRHADGELSERGRRLLSLAGSNTGRLLRAVEEILYLQALQGGALAPEAEEVAVDELVGEVAAAYRARCERSGLELVEEMPEAPARAALDARRLRDLVDRVVDNAVRFTERGRVTVRVEAEAGSGRARAIEVTDTGPGIPAERIASVFEPFHQLDGGDARRHGGLGLGLTVAREIAALLGCRMVLESEPGHGTTCRILLPAPRPSHPEDHALA